MVRALPLAGAGLACIIIAAHGYWKIALVPGALVLAVSGLSGYAIYQSWRVPTGGSFLWRGLVLYRGRDLESLKFLGLRMRRGRIHQFFGWGRSVGYLEIRQSGFHWTAGSWTNLGLGAAEGTIDVPWNMVEVVKVADAPRRDPSLGGMVTLKCCDWDSSLSGEFLGSQEELASAIARATAPQSGSADLSEV